MGRTYIVGGALIIYDQDTTNKKRHNDGEPIHVEEEDSRDSKKRKATKGGTSNLAEAENQPRLSR